MVRMSDLARGGTPAPALPKPQAPPAPVSRPPARTPAPPPPPEESIEETPPSAPPARLRMASLGEEMRATDAARAAERAEALLPPPPVDTGEPAEQILGDLRRFLDRVRDLKAGEGFPWSDLERIIDHVVRSLETGTELFWLANNPVIPKGVDYLSFHPARVAILAVRIAMTLGYERRRLVELGMAAALIGIGLSQLSPNILRRLDALSGDELAQYHAHPRAAAERIRRWNPPVEGLTETVLQCHEREQGQGFPQGIQGTAIRADAKIVGLADTYMGLTAPASLRPGMRPHEAIREIVRGKREAFPSAAIKALLSEISFFPPGTVVRLNTGEIGSVIAVNRNHPLRPRVEVVDGKSGPLTTPKIVDLAEAPFVYIVGPVSETGR